MSNARDSENKQILFLDANEVEGASDYVAADIHGSMEVFSSILALMTMPGDRLILLGDLVDRGDDNVEVIRAIVTRNQSSEDMIYCVLGNHEQMCLDTIRSLNALFSMEERYKKLPIYLRILHVLEEDTFNILCDNEDFESSLGDLLKAELDAELDDLSDSFVSGLMLNEDFKLDFEKWLDECHSILYFLSMHKLNHGEWLFDLYMNEVNEEKILFYEDGSVKFTENSDVGMIKDYMSSLPTVIRVKESAVVPAFNAVHGDMPVSDTRLVKLYDSNKSLSSDRLDYAIWARSLAYGGEVLIDKINKRHHSSIITYTGHSPYDGVRTDTNTVNLDVHSYHTGMALVVNHTKMQCIITNCPLVEENGKKTYVTCKKKLDKVYTETQNQLAMQAKLRPIKSKHKKSKSGANLFAPVGELQDTQTSKNEEKPGSSKKL